MSVRPAAVSGMFYPDNAQDLRAVVQQCLEEARGENPKDKVPKALILPHAGYIYSGPTAAHGYALLGGARNTIKRVVILGPCHRVPVSGLAAPSADAFETPFGRVPVDRKAIETIIDLPQVAEFDATHAQEHSLEVHLPFLQSLLDDFSIVPLVVGDATNQDVAEVLERLWGGEETLIVISSDLTHYLDYNTARSEDAKTTQAIEHLASAEIADHQACGRIPIKGLLDLAKQRRLSVKTLDVRNSGDTAGPKDRVVGYGAWAFYEDGAKPPKGQSEAEATDFEAGTKELLRVHGRAMLSLAGSAIATALSTGQTPRAVLKNLPSPLRETGACFTTLKKAGQLRGCIGSPQAYRALGEDIVDNAVKTAFHDPRFPALSQEELDGGGLALSLAVLSPLAPIAVRSEEALLGQLRPGVDGLVIEDGGRKALFLPAVWKSLAAPEDFLGQLKRKAGLADEKLSGEFKAWRFITSEISSMDLDDVNSIWTTARMQTS